MLTSSIKYASNVLDLTKCFKTWSTKLFLAFTRQKCRNGETAIRVLRPKVRTFLKHYTRFIVCVADFLSQQIVCPCVKPTFRLWFCSTCDSQHWKFNNSWDERWTWGASTLLTRRKHLLVIGILHWVSSHIPVIKKQKLGWFFLSYCVKFVIKS